YTTLLICGMLEFRSKTEKKQLKREFSTGKVKVEVCMKQYEDLFSCYRQPALVEDVQVKKERNDESEHVLVMCRNQAFVVYTRVDGHLLTFGDIIFQLREVVRLSGTTEDLVIRVGASGAGDRDTAALFWNELQKVESNRTSLKSAQEAVFVVCLDHDDTNPTPPQGPSKPQNHEQELVRRAKHLLVGGGTCGNGMNRWYDATIQFIVSRSGTNGLCIEHSTAEGIVSITMAESALRYERENREQVQGEEAEKEVSVKALSWDVSPEAMALLEKQKATLDE
ncbi:Choline/Carnitine O-acyltransferase, partial [Ancylostoma duodenale]